MAAVGIQFQLDDRRVGRENTAFAQIHEFTWWRARREVEVLVRVYKSRAIAAASMGAHLEQRAFIVPVALSTDNVSVSGLTAAIIGDAYFANASLVEEI
jgi:ribulose 1,5-bisphosphate carboxylase large subunit-like protein